MRLGSKLIPLAPIKVLYTSEPFNLGSEAAIMSYYGHNLSRHPFLALSPHISMAAVTKTRAHACPYRPIRSIFVYMLYINPKNNAATYNTLVERHAPRILPEKGQNDQIQPNPETFNQ